MFYNFKILQLHKHLYKGQGANSYFLLEGRVHFPSSPFNLSVSLTQLLLNSILISPCCDSSLALDGP